MKYFWLVFFLVILSSCWDELNTEELSNEVSLEVETAYSETREELINARESIIEPQYIEEEKTQETTFESEDTNSSSVELLSTEYKVNQAEQADEVSSQQYIEVEKEPKGSQKTGSSAY